MFDINAPEFMVLVVIAIVLFGPEKLPEFARKAARVLRYVRNIASNAQDQLSQELGTDVDLRDLNPKAFVQKHLLDDVQPLVDDVKQEFGDVSATGKGARDDIAVAIGQKPISAGAPKAVTASTSSLPAGAHAPFDLEAT